MSRYPSDLYKEFSILGLPAIEGLTSASSDYLHRKLKSCGRFDEIKALDLEI
ncbi:MAG: hypothetical protein R3B45_11020 [Bdellovibrionota bacterium]